MVKKLEESIKRNINKSVLSPKFNEAIAYFPCTIAMDLNLKHTTYGKLWQRLFLWILKLKLEWKYAFYEGVGNKFKYAFLLYCVKVGKYLWNVPSDLSC